MAFAQRYLPLPQGGVMEVQIGRRMYRPGGKLYGKPKSEGGVKSRTKKKKRSTEQVRITRRNRLFGRRTTYLMGTPFRDGGGGGRAEEREKTKLLHLRQKSEGTPLPHAVQEKRGNVRKRCRAAKGTGVSKEK